MDSGINGLPLVVRVGFVGSRVLLDPADKVTVSVAAARDQIEEQLLARLKGLPIELGLSNHFLCGVSQIAIGADTVFARACGKLGIKQRIFLPQPTDDYLAAMGSSGPDFSAAEQAEARALLLKEHIVQVRVVSSAGDRRARFEDTNLEIVCGSDVVLCLFRERAGKGPGGTTEALELALRRGIPVLELRVLVVDGAPTLEGKWHGKEVFAPPSLPRSKHGHAEVAEARELPAPTFELYSADLRRLASKVANWRRQLFSGAALAVIGAHLLATILATSALALHHAAIVPVLLGVEVLLLLGGFAVHHHLHHSEASRVWAFTRAASEAARSVRAVTTVHVPLDYLSTLPYPAALQPLLRTLGVLHLAASRAVANDPWQPKRDAYVKDRVLGQHKYYSNNYPLAKRHSKWADRLFLGCTSLAVLATATKLVIVLFGHHAGKVAESVAPLLGTFAIVLPVLAVGALSLAAALDRDARASIFKQMSSVLERQKARLEAAASEREFVRLILETEDQLVGENANWFARRTFTGVS